MLIVSMSCSMIRIASLYRPMDIGQQLRKRSLAVGLQSRQHFIQQQNSRLCRQGFCNFKCFQFSQRELGGGIPGRMIGEVNQIKNLRERMRIYATGAESLRDSQVFGHGQRMHRLGYLERAPDSASRPRVGRQWRNVGTIKAQASVMRPHGTGDHIEHRGFAGAVRPDQSDDFTCSDRKRHVVDGLQSAKAHADICKLKHRASRWPGAFDPNATGLSQTRRAGLPGQTGSSRREAHPVRSGGRWA